MNVKEHFTVSELLDDFQKNEMVLPAFMPQIKIPIIGKIKAAMRDSLVRLMIT